MKEMSVSNDFGSSLGERASWQGRSTRRTGQNTDRRKVGVFVCARFDLGAFGNVRACRVRREGGGVDGKRRWVVLGGTYSSCSVEFEEEGDAGAGSSIIISLL
jgi:hypothetical protein